MIAGTIPCELGYLSNLEQLYLNSNSLTGKQMKIAIISCLNSFWRNIEFVLVQRKRQLYLNCMFMLNIIQYMMLVHSISARISNLRFILWGNKNTYLFQILACPSVFTNMFYFSQSSGRLSIWTWIATEDYFFLYSLPTNSYTLRSAYKLNSSRSKLLQKTRFTFHESLI